MSVLLARRFALPAGDAWMLLLSVLVLLPHLSYLPVLLAVLCGVIWLLDLLLMGLRVRLSRPVKAGLVLAALAILWIGVVQRTEVSLGLALVCLVIALKPLETHDRRSRRSFALLCYFGALIFFFQDQSDLWLAYYAAYLVVLTGFVLRVEHLGLETGPALKNAVALLVQALPLAIVLFYLFPRLPEPLWHWGDSSGESVTGVPDEVELHTLNALAESGEVAFEARFDGPVPEVSSLYWRGPIYYFTDGRVWDSDYFPVTPMAPERLAASGERSPEPGPDRGASESMPLTARADETIGYRISEADGFRHWLIALDLPVEETSEAMLTEDYQLVPRRRVGSKLSYRMTSALSIQTPPDSEAVYLKALQLPFKARMAKDARLLGEALQAESAGDAQAAQQIIRRILQYFAEGPFYYALDTPQSVTNPIDEFLFEERRGYCTHYAAAMTLILRAAEVPARMILGYRGGEWSRAKGAVIVRQRHAHAWVEAWTPTFGWLRVDPTGVIPPERVFAQDPANGEASAFNERVLGSLAGADELRRFLRPRAASPAGQGGPAGGDVDPLQPRESALSLGYIADMGEYLWTGWVKDYNHERQQHLVGMSGGWPAASGLALAVIAGALLVYVARALLRRRRATRGSARRVSALYALLGKRLARLGIRTLPQEPHQSLHRRLVATGRFDPYSLSELFTTYERLRYRQHEQQAGDKDLRGFRRQIARLRVRSDRKQLQRQVPGLDQGRRNNN